MAFTLDSRLAADTITLCHWPLSQVLLMDDRRFPWVILVPMRAGMTELFDLSPDDQQQLTVESMTLGRCLKHHYQADKINIAALGNQVAQLHIHHIARFTDDVAWPGPVWNSGTTERYGPSERMRQTLALQHLLQPLFQETP